MKLTWIFISIFSLGGYANTWGQTVDLDVKNSTVKTVFSEIRKQTGYRFIYEEGLLKSDWKITLTAKGELQHVLDKIKEKYPLIYHMHEGTIVVKRAIGTVVEPKRASAEEQQVVEGLVHDTDGEPLVGVSVAVVGSTNQTATDATGAFKILAVQGDSIRFSYVGYDVVTKLVDGNPMKVTMHVSEAAMLEDVVITAFGKKERKEAMVGSVTSISPKELKVPSSNLTTALAGRLAGLISYQRSGEPGADNAQFFIRGVTTFGVNNIPLILIDNVELTTQDLARLQPDDIESFSILKDASATALYGARGANGVILVTTKEGKEGKAVLNMRVENSFSMPTRMVELADPITYMQLYSEAQLTRGELSLKYNPNKVDNTVLGLNPYVFPSTDWQRLMFKEYTSNQRANFSVSGGGGVAQYYIAGTFNRDNGILEVPNVNNFNNNIQLNTYALRSNTSISITPTTKVVVRLSGTFDDYNGPIDGGGTIFQKSLRTSPTSYAPFYEPDEANRFTEHILFGNYNNGEFLNPYADMVKGYKEYASSRMIAQFELHQDMSAITEGLSLRGLASTNRYSYYDISRNYNPFYYNVGSYDIYTDQYQLIWLNEGPEPTEYLNFNPGAKSVTSHLYALGALEYDRLFSEKHNIGGSLIGTIEQSSNPNEATLQLSLPKRNIGVSGRVTYGYDRRYFAEFNFGYNGSEKFYEDKRFGFFPVVGASWVISNERFWEPLHAVVTKLKIRGSYGLAGNDAIGRADQRFFYLSNVNLNDESRGGSFGFQNLHNRPGVSISDYGNYDITWETSEDMNIALEVGLKHSFNVIAEYYIRNRSNILMARASVPATMGLAALTYANVGSAYTNGVDLTADYTKSFNNGLWVTARGNFTFARSEYDKFEEPEYKESYLLHKGQSLGQQWGYIAERLFIDEMDVRNSPKQNFGPYEAGDIKYTDVNGDGEITSLDRVPIGHPTTPEIIYGFGFSTGYKGFDLSAFFQGSARSSFWIDAHATSPFINYDNPSAPINGGKIGENALLKAYANDHWSEDNQNSYALWPRLSTSVNSNNIQRSTWFMNDGSFLRLKSAELGYSLPEEWTHRFKIKNLRVYMSGTNLMTFSAFKLWDVEMGGNGLGYPVQRVYNIGINVNL